LEDNNIKTDIEWTWRDFYEIMDKVSSKGIYAAPKYPEEYILLEMIKDSIDYFIDWDKKGAKFDSKEFRDILELLMVIYSGNYEFVYVVSHIQIFYFFQGLNMNMAVPSLSFHIIRNK